MSVCEWGKVKRRGRKKEKKKAAMTGKGKDVVVFVRMQ